MPFSYRAPRDILFGRGQAGKAAAHVLAFGRRVVLVHGATPQRAQALIDDLAGQGADLRLVACASEPDLPNLITTCDVFRDFDAQVVVAIGGGSVIDFAKALSALLVCHGPARDYLEIVGTGRRLDAAPLPMVALPTTAGTGAEVTKNAVITVPDRALKVSLRDPRMVPQVAIIDPDLMQGAPTSVVLPAALDAITQVIEPYVGRNPNPMTDALCAAAIPRGLRALRPLIEDNDAKAMDDMAWVSTSGGLALAHAGLGAVHGFAGVIGGQTGAAHGAICGALLVPVLRANLATVPANHLAAERLRWVVSQITQAFGGLGALEVWARGAGLLRLSAMGVQAADVPGIVTASQGASSMKGNPVTLTTDQLTNVLTDAL